MIYELLQIAGRDERVSVLFQPADAAEEEPFVRPVKVDRGDGIPALRLLAGMAYPSRGDQRQRQEGAEEVSECGEPGGRRPIAVPRPFRGSRRHHMRKGPTPQRP